MIIGAISRTNNEIEPHFNTIYVCLANLLLFLLLSFYNFWVLQSALTTQAKFFSTLGGSLLIAALFTVVSFRLEAAIDSTGNPSNPFYMNLIINLTAGLISFLVSLLINNLTEHQRVVLENQQLQSENILTRYQTLQQQLSPHFLFNSLNTLDGLMETDPTGAHRYLHQLAATFRYSMQKQNEVTLDEELEFTQSYIYLMQIRHGKNLEVRQEIDPKFLSGRVPPISLQLLVENAIKHNIVSQRHPLTILIATTPDRHLQVSNPLHPKADSEASSGTGLANLAQRYRLLFGREISILNDGETFTVKIPII